MAGHYNLLNIPGNQQVAHFAIALDAGFIAADLDIGIVGCIGNVAGGLIIMNGEEILSFLSETSEQTCLYR